MKQTRLEYLESLLDSETPDEFTLYAIAQEHIKLGDDKKAIAFFHRILTANEDYVGLYYHLANCHIRLGHDGEASETYRKGIAVAKKLNDLHALSELQNARTNFELDL